MSHENQSVISSPASISGVVSISDVDSTISVEDKAIIPGTPRKIEDQPFDLGDGDLSIMANGVTLETHRYLIKRFSGLKNRIRNNVITLEPGEPGLEDFRNTLKVLYASVVEGPFHFDPATLTSALRTATSYDYPALRSFTINQLEKASLSAVERIRLARKFGLPSWEEPAYVELCDRDEAITKAEASVLGLDAFVHVARIREKEQRRRGKDTDAAMESHDEYQTGEEPATQSSGAKGKKRKVKKASSVTPNPDSSEGDQDESKGTPIEKDKKEEVNIVPQPSLIDVQINGTHWRSQTLDTYVHELPGCACVAGDAKWRCALPPCAARALKYLQTQQLAHNTNIPKLESSLTELQATLSSLTAASKPCVGLGADEPDQTGSVQEEVRKWLAGLEIGTAIASETKLFI